MTDVAIINDGVVESVVRRASLESVVLPDTGSTLVKVEAPEDEVFGGMVWDGEEFGPPLPIPLSEGELGVYAAAVRWEKEVGGTVWNGWTVHTDRESQGKIAAERLAIQAGERSDLDGWKFADGVFRPVTNADFVTMASAVREHVRACYAAEAVVLSGIAEGEIASTEEIDAVFAGV